MKKPDLPFDLPKEIADEKDRKKALHDEMKRDYKKRWRKQNPDKVRKYRNDANRRLRVKVLIHYGGDPPTCACCGESHLVFLCIDHIKGKGTAMRKLDVFHRNLYHWLRKHEFPSGFQVLCYNCNNAKGRSQKRFCPVHHPELY